MEFLRQTPLLGPSLARLKDRHVLIHARRSNRDLILGRQLDFFNALESMAADRGLPVRVVAARDRNRRAAADGPHLHVFMGGRGLVGRHVLHASPGYLRGFWYCDPEGARWHASIARQPFDPDAQPADRAEAFANDLRDQLVAGNASKYSQPPPGATLEPGCIVLFAQQPIAATEGQFHMDMPALIAATAAARSGRRLYIKPHPRQRPDLRARIDAFHDPAAGVEVVDASVHDLLRACALTVSLASAAAFEGFLHGKPAVLAGRSDFHHNAVTATRPAEVGPAMERALGERFHHAAYLWWFLKDRSLEPQAPDFADRLAARIRATGFAF